MDKLHRERTMRKTRVKGGDQHAMSVRIDNELWEWLQGEQNKNRLINECLEFVKYMQHQPAGRQKILHGRLYEAVDVQIWE